MDEELVEAAARASYEDSDNRPDWGPWEGAMVQRPLEDGKSIADIYRQAARAVIPIVQEHDAKVAEGRFWLSLREPGRVPERKGP